ncbi:hypothetical protein EVAR_48554_1 [Eumeta japonica]|uniref:Uncharacterized protein n=1 Tax=Eumeta variegata TaxID=151549 RepID=A0A4C1YAK4_EUMVA|nr:hypothetical protein EVAR_48554_1 [Eumeta japonica]
MIVHLAIQHRRFAFKHRKATSTRRQTCEISGRASRHSHGVRPFIEMDNLKFYYDEGRLCLSPIRAVASARWPMTFAYENRVMVNEWSLPASYVDTFGEGMSLRKVVHYHRQHICLLSAVGCRLTPAESLHIGAFVNRKRIKESSAKKHSDLTVASKTAVDVSLKGDKVVGGAPASTCRRARSDAGPIRPKISSMSPGVGAVDAPLDGGSGDKHGLFAWTLKIQK